MNNIGILNGVVSLAKLKERLLKLTASGDRPYVVREEGDKIIASWNIIDAKWAGILNKAGLSRQFELRLSFDEKKKRVRCQQKIKSIDWGASLDQIQFGKEVEFGNRCKFEHGIAWGITEDNKLGKVYDYSFATTQITDPIFEVIKNSGWQRNAGFIFSGRKNIILGIAGFALILAIVAFMLFSILGEVKDSARTQIDMLRAGKITEVYEASAARLKNNLTPEEFSAAISEMPLTQIKKYSFNHIAVNNDRAEIKGYYITDAGDKREIEVGMKKEDDKWKLTSLTLSD